MTPDPAPQLAGAEFLKPGLGDDGLQLGDIQPEQRKARRLVLAGRAGRVR